MRRSKTETSELCYRHAGVDYNLTVGAAIEADVVLLKVVNGVVWLAQDAPIWCCLQ